MWLAPRRGDIPPSTTTATTRVFNLRHLREITKQAHLLFVLATRVSCMRSALWRRINGAGKPVSRALAAEGAIICLIASAVAHAGSGALIAGTAEEAPRNFFAASQEMKLGSELASEFEAVANRIDNRQLGRYVSALGARLTPDAAGPVIHPRFRIFADAGLHAFAFPGGRIYISTGIVASAENEAQLAGLLAHSLAHAVLRHSTNAASRKAPFRVRAALVAAATGHSTLAQGMRAIGMEPGLGGDLMGYGQSVEQQADSVAAQMVAAAGYAPAGMEKFLGFLRTSGESSFAGRHPQALASTRAETSPPGPAGTAKPLAGPAKFARLKQRAAKIRSTDSGVAALLDRQPPAETKKSTQGPIEVYRTPHFEFAYPLVWRPNRPGPGEPLVVTPQGGMYHPAGSEPRVETGMIGGSFELLDASQSALDALTLYLREARPGLIHATDQPSVPSPLSPVESVFFEGDSPRPGHRELVWAIAAKKQENIYYLLLIAPKNSFSQLNAVFSESVRSFQLH